MEFTKEKILKVIILFASIVGVAGSFTLSFSGNVPCPYCWTSRICVILIAIISAGSLYYSNIYFPVAILIISIPSIVSSSILVRNDFSATPGVCTENGAECFSPVFMGIHASIYALLISLFIFAGAVVLIYFNLKSKQ